ncbi:efflux transporter outer membrane subunit [Thauera linaloolentis]|uniref:NodT family RND efflux system outer membrane lipoprotein n=1 Tax=Thauera linaloolentis (strain DSM 12138 / JCM 21573 / CCUG 41526 / CIP 105981 / IAM 15112 / NBRC 102519 / 47Lol) TaxID=1123367 RepID=N6YAR9_THAL4|nr:efflux transporter outer membrane subunit [Thauera linaloolentis]ENO88620.1 NodT family RND efflux system outer membrane lipoprotein [Thauera linaloolentis 47Lol = DSM 12138]MCM8565665.1 efflux transporter outer membrane subunit [Thauera linaloolentis]
MAVATALLTACAITEPVARPDLAMPAQWSEATEASRAATADISDTWWQSFGSPQLDALVAEAMLSAPDLLIQAERVIQAELALRQAGASLLPSLSLGGGSSVQNAEGKESGSTNANLSARYEIDLWGRLAATRDASRASLAATRFDRDAARLSMTASVATLWFQALALDERADIARQNLAIAERVLKVVQARYDNGAASALELSQQRSTVLSQRKAIEPLEITLRQTRSALAILLGRNPQAGFLDDERLAQLHIPAVEAGLPSDLLLRRPDLASSEARLVAASANLAAARGALLPSISLSAGASAASAELLSLSGHNSVLSLSASLLQTIFDGGRLAADVDIQRSRQRELVETHRQTVLAALKEVEDALSNAVRDANQETAQREILTEAQRSLRLAELRYREGADSLLTVLDAQRALFSAQDQLAQLRLTRLTDAVTLYRVLGGGWNMPEAPAPTAG